MVVKYISGTEDIKELFELTIDNNEKLLRTALSDKPLVYLAGDDFADYYMNKRLDAGIFLKSLRFTSEDVDKPNHKVHKNLNKEARIASDDIVIEDSVVIWDDNVAIVNFQTKSGIIITDSKNAKIMKKWFDYIWDRSKD